MRFRPDSLLEGLLRPFVMMDPQSGIYFEGIAPDWRFGMFAALLLLGAASTRGQRGLSFAQGQLSLGLLASMLMWTFLIGNGRYYMAGLLLIGPLVVAGWRSLPGTTALRYTLLAGATALQLAVVLSTHVTDKWGLGQWQRGEGIDIQASPLRQEPAVFITSTSISFAILVPKFHPNSRWTNVVGQYDITPSTREFAPLIALLSSALPKYAVWPISAQPGGAELQPSDRIRQAIAEHLRPLGVTLQPQRCVTLRSSLAPGPPGAATTADLMRGFWFCPVDYSETLRLSPSELLALSAAVTEAFHAIEQRCPRFFPPGGGNNRRDTGFTALRHYTSTDMRVIIDDQDQVLMRHNKSLNPTLLGSVEQVRSGHFTLPCDKPQGRYQLPWQRD